MQRSTAHAVPYPNVNTHSPPVCANLSGFHCVLTFFIYQKATIARISEDVGATAAIMTFVSKRWNESIEASQVCACVCVCVCVCERLRLALAWQLGWRACWSQAATPQEGVGQRTSWVHPVTLMLLTICWTLRTLRNYLSEAGTVSVLFLESPCQWQIISFVSY